MRIYMIGAGAMGGVYGGLLARAGYDVTLIDPREDHIRKIQSEGITIEGVRGTHVIRLPAQCDHAGLAARRSGHHLYRLELDSRRGEGGQTIIEAGRVSR